MSEEKWAYHLPVFESDKYNKEMMVYSPWSGHRHFAYDYVCFKKPQKIVELGSYYGCSAFAFLQAIKDKSLDSKFYGIDTWQGDRFTKKDYQEDIYAQYKRIQDTCFHNQNTNMVRMTFDKAVKIFADKSIDLLHIDGSHSYADVKHDFLVWKDKVKEDGVIFFHDTGKDKLLGEVMGSHIFWEEVKQEYEHTIEFPFSFGLGVLFFSETEYQKMIERVDFLPYQRLVNYADAQNKDTIRKYYFKIRELKKYNNFLKEQIQINSEQLNKYQKDADEQNQYIAGMEQEQCDLQKRYQICAAEIEQLTNALTDAVSAYKKTITEKDCYIAELEKRRKADILGKDEYIAELKQAISDYQADISGKDEYTAQLRQVITNYQADISGKDKYIAELRQVITNYQTDVSGKEGYIVKLQQSIGSYQKDTLGKDAYIIELGETIERYQADVLGKEGYIAKLQQAIGSYQKDTAGKDAYIIEIGETIERYQLDIRGKETYITKLLIQVEEWESFADSKESYIKELLNDIEKYNVTFRGKDKYISELELRSETLNEQLQVGQRLLVEREAHIAQQQEQLAKMQKHISILEAALSKMPFGKYIYKRLENANEGNKNE